MKKFLFNLMAFSLLTGVFVFAFMYLQSNSNNSSAKQEEKEEGGEGAYCAEHRLGDNSCGICKPQLIEQLKPGQSMKVRLGSAESAAKAGIETVSPIIGNIQLDQSFLCTVLFNQDRTAQISPLAEGVVQKIFVDLGATVVKGQVLMEIASSQVAVAKSNYIKALDQERLKSSTYQREKNLADKNISAKQDFQQAEAEYQLAKTETITTRQQLVNLGLSPDEIDAVEKQRSNTSLLKLTAPFSGTLVEKRTALGESVKTGESVFQLVDTTSMWLEISIPEAQISRITKGEPVTAVFDALPGLEISGGITWISSRLDENTRMLKARALVSNPEEKLKQGLFGHVRIKQNSTEKRFLIPFVSVQDIDGKTYVFVKQDEADLFDIRRVTVGNKSETQYEIVEGISEKDRVVSASSYTLKSEFLKSRFGAGCADD